MLNGHVQISHLIYAQQDWYLSLLENVYVGNHMWLSVEVQLGSPVNLGLLTAGKGEPCVARDEVVSHPMRVWFNCFDESLHCTPTAHGLCATIAKDDIHGSDAHAESCGRSNHFGRPYFC